MNELWDKLWSVEFGIALLGAVVGGVFTMLGSWWQSKASNKAAARVQAQGHALRGFEAISALRVRLEEQSFQGRGTTQTRDIWNRELMAQLALAKGAVALLPDQHEETRDAAMTSLQMITRFTGIFGWNEYKIATNTLLTEALRHLGRFVRGSKPREARDMDAVLTTAIDDHNREWARKELDALNAEAEHSELDDDAKEEARKIREYLGIPHPPEPSTADHSGIAP
ncbi:hypothetical protein [Streptomyces anulatus]|uniref:hypothetical protein n=1 Tax=Streptomyces anulatus TaxID=1892 RepID=UPI00341B16BE